MSRAERIRVIQVVGGMNRGGAETWLMHVLRHMDRERFQIDFMTHTEEPCAYDEEIRALGSRIVPCLQTSRPLTYADNFRDAMREHGPYDVIHSHVHHFSGYVLRLARRVGIPKRLAHSHIDTSSHDAGASIARRGYLTLMKRWISTNATLGLAASREAATALFSSEWERDPRRSLLYCGIDLEPFRATADRAAVRELFGIPWESFVIGHVGRFHEQKNHRFLMDIASETVKRDPEMRLLLAGVGPLEPEIRAQVERAGVSKNVVFAGLQSDIPRLLGALDAFVLPSIYEGLPLVGLEAQAAGLPFTLSDSVTKELDVVFPLITRLSLKQPAADWAEQLLTTRENGAPVTRTEAVESMAKSPFNVVSGVKRLEAAYDR